MRQLLTIFFSLHIFLFSIKGQEYNTIQGQYWFKSITVDEGLSNNHIISICQDSLGYIWFSTSYGVDKYNGTNVTGYRYDQGDHTSLSSNDVKVIFTDSKNQTWIGSTGGLDLYNIEKDNFIRFSRDSVQLSIGIVDDIVEDKEGKLWIASTNGLFVYDLIQGQFEAHRSNNNTIDSLLSGHILRLFIDSRNNVWISCFMRGVCVYNQSAHSYLRFVSDPNDISSISGNRIERFYEDRSGTIWIGTYNNGLNIYNREGRNFTRIIPDKNDPYSTRVRAIFEDPEDRLFIGTRGGVYVFSKKKKTFTHYAYLEHPISQLSQNSILCSFIDRTGSLWLGTFAGGVNYTDLHAKEFILFSGKQKGKFFLSSTDVFAITEDREKNLWVATGNGLNYFNRKTSTFHYLFHDPDNPQSLGYNDVKALEWDKNGYLWVGTNKGGLNRFNPHTGKFERYVNDPEDDNSITYNKIYGLLCDDDNNLWILSNIEIDNQYSSIDIFHISEGIFTHVKEKAYFGISQNLSGDIYIGSINGFWKFVKKDSLFIFISDSNYIGKVYSTYEDSRGIVWIGSDKGLAGYRKLNNPAYYFSEKEGNPIGIVYGILEDDKRNLWVSTNLGLVKISNIDKSHVSATFTVFDRKDGIQGKQFNYNAYYKLSTGELAFGGINGFNLFDPEKIKQNTLSSNVVITDLKVYNQPVKIGQEMNGRVILEQSLQTIPKITLTRKEDAFTLEFISLHYACPEQNKYKYTLEGFEKRWHIKDASNRVVSYTHLPGGTYTFKVYGSNNDGVWSDTPATLTIVVIPLFWETLWFKLLVVFVIIAGALGYYYIKMHTIKRQKAKLEYMVDAKTKEVSEKNEMLLDQADYLSEANTILEERQMQIEEQAEELKVQKEQLENMNKKLSELNVTKDKFFSIIAHDLKNPFQTISGFMELLERRYDVLSEEKKKKFIGTVSITIKNTYDLLENLLSWSRSQTKSIKFAPDICFLHDIILESLNLIRSYADKKGVNIVSETDTNIEVFVDKNMISTVIRNLLSNAVKFTPKGGEVHITVTADEDEEVVAICIADNGIGMDKNRVDTLFQIDKSRSKQGTDGELGTGLGLIICKEFIERNKGNIRVESEPGKGSKFFIELPLKK